MAVYRRVHDMHVCVAVGLLVAPPPGPWPCMLSPAADCLESGISCGPLRSSMSMGTFTLLCIAVFASAHHHLWYIDWRCLGRPRDVKPQDRDSQPSRLRQDQHVPVFSNQKDWNQTETFSPQDREETFETFHCSKPPRTRWDQYIQFFETRYCVCSIFKTGMLQKNVSRLSLGEDVENRDYIAGVHIKWPWSVIAIVSL